MPADAESYLDLRGLKCPLPVLRTQKLLNRLDPGARAVVECTDPLSVIDIPHLVRMRGDLLEDKQMCDGVYVFHIRRQAAVKSAAKNLAAVIFESSDDVNRVMADFVAMLEGRGRQLAGVIQVSANTRDCACAQTHVLDLGSGARIAILQDLGTQSQACRADNVALAEVGAILLRAMRGAPDLICINRFGRLEAEGKGLREEIGAAALSGIPVLIGVGLRYRDAWHSFAQGLAEELVCDGEALEDWWQRLATARRGGEMMPSV